MPKKNVDYSKTLIYKIVCKDISITDCYVGNTTNFTQRKRGHKSICNNEKDKKYNLSIYQFIRENGGWDNFDMIEIEKYPCNDANEAKKQERFFIELYNAKLNTRLPSRTKKQYHEDNKQIENVKCKIYYDKNKEMINRKMLCECGCEVNSNHKKRHERSKKHIDFLKLKPD